MASISVSVVVGFFCLTNGCCLTREHAETKETVNSYYTVYSTSISSVNPDDAFTAEVRIYSPPRDPLLPEYTVAYIMAKMYAPSNSVVLLDSLQCFPFPGDPSNDGYDSIFPSAIPTFIFVLGNVPTAHTTDAIGSRLFNMNITEYVRDAPRNYALSCIFDVRNIRWTRVRPPAPNSTAQIFGSVIGLTENGNLCINIESYQSNISTTTSMTPATPTSMETLSPSPSKRRKFQAPMKTALANPNLDSRLSPTPIQSPHEDVFSSSSSTIMSGSSQEILSTSTTKTLVPLGLLPIPTITPQDLLIDDIANVPQASGSQVESHEKKKGRKRN